MPKITDSYTVKDGYVIGFVETNRVGSKCEFEVCSVEEFEKLSEEDALNMLVNAAHDSSQVEYHF